MARTTFTTASFDLAFSNADPVHFACVCNAVS
jgi:hypothetical protein